MKPDLPSPLAWRWLTALLLAAVAGIHVALVPAHLREAPYAAWLFITLSASAVMVAILLVLHGHRMVWRGAGALSVMAVLAYVASRSVGLPSLSDDLGDWLNPLGVGALLCETTAALICWNAGWPSAGTAHLRSVCGAGGHQATATRTLKLRQTASKR